MSVESVAVVAREDAFVLRMALIVRSVNEEVPLLLTIFDQTMAERVTGEMANTQRDLARRNRRAVAGRTLHR